jgi:hypothetical protein
LVSYVMGMEIWDCELVTDSRDDLLNLLVGVALALQDVLPARVSSAGLQPQSEGLGWPAGVALQRMVDAGISAGDVAALVRQVRVRAIADAIAVMDQSATWAICGLADGVHEPLSGLDSEFWFLANLHR